ncbi:fimbrial protein StiA [Klebsiella huaxiensis]|uniref:Fimbrial protein n=1 Tax=Klebsiella huaxiensis TaxID=2153354 RepID=A0A564H7F0_9ENTR|nr:fimbrial protein [Klebsiella huaxiensis]MDG1641467.1 fimbrial protein [Klebsiella huaxiensis]QBG09924.1 fimbrial protein StiA [Klebsiella huaxiensis]VUS27828.1 Fimbrial subunit type 1 [Klebsiella huaxiensis]VUS96048.1 Fimbrial subunit type 1 [Klebsiella huaxiensis]
MKINVSLFILASIIASPMAFAADSSGDGQVHITGKIIESACTIATTSKDLNVTLEDRNTTAFVSAGDTSAEQQFKIKLENCSTTSYQNVKVRFEGTQDTEANSTVLKNTGEAAGVGVQILDNGTPMDVVSHSGWSATNFNLTDNEGSPELPFTARYYATKAQSGITAGTVDTTATFYLQYN